MPSDCHSEFAIFWAMSVYKLAVHATGLFKFWNFVQPFHNDCGLPFPQTAYAMALPFCFCLAFHYSPWLWPVFESHFCHLSLKSKSADLSPGHLDIPFFYVTWPGSFTGPWTLGCPYWWNNGSLASQLKNSSHRMAFSLVMVWLW